MSLGTKCVWFLVAVMGFHSRRAAADIDYQMILCIESQEGSIRNVQGALREGANPTFSCDAHFADRTPLHRAADRGHAEIIKMLLDHGAIAVLETKDNLGRTPVLHAAGNGHSAALRELLAAGAKAEADTFKGQTPLLLAAKKGYGGAVEALLKYGADGNQRDPNGNTPLLWAAQAGALKAVDALLDHGVDVNATNNKGETALLMAATTTQDVHYMMRPSLAMQHSSCVKALVKARADVNRRSNGGMTPLMSATRWSNSTRVLKALVDGGADMDIQDDIGRTALMFASYMDFRDAIKLLIERGCNWELQNHDGWTAETITIELKHPEARQLFNIWRYNHDWDITKNPFYKPPKEIPPEVRALYEEL